MASSALHTLRRARPWLGTLVDITLQGDDVGQLASTMEACFAAIEHVHRLMSFHEASSDISRLNRGAAHSPVQVAPAVIAVLKIAQTVSIQSAGLFDITVADRLIRNGTLPRLYAIESTTDAASWRDVRLLADNHVQFRRPLLIDLGGIAKGFAVDQAIAVCARTEPTLHSARINAGGDLARYGQRENTVQIRYPIDNAKLLSIDCRQHGSIATSAYGYDRPVHIAPRGHDGTAPFASATVMASTCVIADALTKVVMLDDVGNISAHCLDYFSADALLIDRHGAVHRSAACGSSLAAVEIAHEYA